MSDLLYLAIGGGFFAFSWWLIRFCDRLERSVR